MSIKACQWTFRLRVSTSTWPKYIYPNYVNLLGASILGQASRKQRLLAGTAKIRRGEGVFLSDLLRQSQCEGAPCQNLANYEHLNAVWLGMQLHEDPWMDINEDRAVNFQRLSTFMDDYLDAIDAELERYFPEDDLMKTMASLDQSSWPVNIMKVLEDSELISDIKMWPSHFHLGNYTETQFFGDFSNLIVCVNEHQDFWCNNRDSEPEKFWSALLSSPCRNQMSYWLVFLIKASLCTPLGSADAERCFSR